MIPMQRRFKAEDLDTLSKVRFLVGDESIIQQMTNTPAKQPFDKEMIQFLSNISKKLMGMAEAKGYPEVVTLGFWLRRANLKQLNEKYGFKDENIHFGRGIAFHIAPSNVPVNFAYSLFTGLMAGNCNIVRVPSKKFEQVCIIVETIKAVLDEFEELKPFIAIVCYDRNKDINDFFSSLCNIRIIWGGDQTIADIRRSPLPPRSIEVTFADRYSLAIIDSDTYMETDNKICVAQDFYNDTYLSDQNACTSPRLVVWIGKQKEEAKKIFWDELYNIVHQKYKFQSIMAVNKLTSSYLAVISNESFIENHGDNLLVRVKISKLTADLIEQCESCGFFFEYDTDDLKDLKEICDDKRVQTVSVFGEKKLLKELVMSGVGGVDRVTNIGHTLDFDLTWDGYNLMEHLSRSVVI